MIHIHVLTACFQQLQCSLKQHSCHLSCAAAAVNAAAVAAAATTAAAAAATAAAATAAAATTPAALTATTAATAAVVAHSNQLTPYSALSSTGLPLAISVRTASSRARCRSAMIRGGALFKCARLLKMQNTTAATSSTTTTCMCPQND
eukprot:6338-Heterococcus_DN1.PRE.1